MHLWVSYKKKYEKNNNFFTSLKSLKKGFGSGSGVGSGSGFISQNYGSGDPDPYQHQNVTDPQHCKLLLVAMRPVLHVEGSRSRPGIIVGSASVARAVHFLISLWLSTCC